MARTWASSTSFRNSRCGSSAAAEQQPSGKVPFEIQGDGARRAASAIVDDWCAACMVMRDKGEHLGIYHVGTTEEVTIADLARRIAAHAGREIELVPGAGAAPAAPSGAAPTFEAGQARL